MIRAVIFDLDGTLGDTLPLCIKAFRASIEPLASRTFSDAEIVATFGPSEEGTIRMLIPEEYDRGLAAVLKRWKGITRQEVIYVGDAPSDVTASRHAGVAVIGAAWAPATNTGRLEAAQPDKLFHSVAAFSKWLEAVSRTSNS
jgi:phosphoglycolate phosphatase-like HAD superfamily hydrolase